MVGADVPAAPLRPTPITRADMPLGRAALSPLAVGASAPLPQEPTVLQRLQADKPFSAGLQAAGEALAQASGYTEQPKDTLSMINQAMAAFNQAQRQQAMIEAQTALSKQQREQEMALEREKLEQAMAIAEMQAGTTKTQKAFGQEKDLRGEFTKQSKEFEDALLGFEKVQKAALTKEPSGASDIALVFGFMKVLDPNSVVREGEFATAANAGGAWEVLGNTYNKLLRGELLTPTVRKKFVKQAREQFLPYIDKQEAREASFIGLTSSYGLDPDKVVSTKLPKMGTLARPYSVMSDEEAEKLPKGSYVLINGRLGRIK